MVIKSNLGVLLAQCQLKTGAKVSYDQIRQVTGISSNTLSRLVNNKVTRVDFATLSALCKYFDCTPGDLLVYIPDPKERS